MTRDADRTVNPGTKPVAGPIANASGLPRPGTIRDLVPEALGAPEPALEAESEGPNLDAVAEVAGADDAPVAEGASPPASSCSSPRSFIPSPV